MSAAGKGTVSTFSFSLSLLYFFFLFSLQTKEPLLNKTCGSLPRYTPGRCKTNKQKTNKTAKGLLDSKFQMIYQMMVKIPHLLAHQLDITKFKKIAFIKHDTSLFVNIDCDWCSYGQHSPVLLRALHHLFFRHLSGYWSVGRVALKCQKKKKMAVEAYYKYSHFI